MRLRTRVQPPTRFEDEINSPLGPTGRVDKPAFPRLLQAQVVPFNPYLPSAAFPTRNFNSPTPGNDIKSLPLDPCQNEDVMDENGRHTGENFLDRSLHSQDLSSPALLASGFLDDCKTSDEEDDEANLFAPNPTPRTAESISWNRLATNLQVEIFVNLSQQLGHSAASSLLGLDYFDLEAVDGHAARRDSQIISEDLGIQDMQKDQLNLLLRTDHSSKLRTENWPIHNDITRHYLGHLVAGTNYLICTRSEIRLAQLFLDERELGHSLIGCWNWSGPKDAASTSMKAKDPVKYPDRDEVDPRYISEAAATAGASMRTTAGASAGTATEHVPHNTIILDGRDHPRPREQEKPVKASSKVSRGSRRRKRSPSPDDKPEVAKVSQDDLNHPSGFRGGNKSMRLRARNQLKKSMAAQEYEMTESMIREHAEHFTDLSPSGLEKSNSTETQSSLRLRVLPPKLPAKHSSPAIPFSPRTKRVVLKFSPNGRAKLRRISEPASRHSPNSMFTPQTPEQSQLISAEIRRSPKHPASHLVYDLPVQRELFGNQNLQSMDEFQSYLYKINTAAAGSGMSRSVLSRALVVPVSSASRARISVSSTISKNIGIDQQVELQVRGRQVPSQRKNSTAYDDVPARSPITERSTSLSGNGRIPAMINMMQNDVSNSSDHLGLDPYSFVPSRPRTPPHTVRQALKPNIAENGSPILSSVLPKQNQARDNVSADYVGLGIASPGGMGPPFTQALQAPQGTLNISSVSPAGSDQSSTFHTPVSSPSQFQIKYMQDSFPGVRDNWTSAHHKIHIADDPPEPAISERPIGIQNTQSRTTSLSKDVIGSRSTGREISPAQYPALLTQGWLRATRGQPKNVSIPLTESHSQLQNSTLTHEAPKRSPQFSEAGGSYWRAIEKLRLLETQRSPEVTEQGLAPLDPVTPPDKRKREPSMQTPLKMNQNPRDLRIARANIGEYKARASADRGSAAAQAALEQQINAMISHVSYASKLPRSPHTRQQETSVPKPSALANKSKLSDTSFVVTTRKVAPKSDTKTDSVSTKNDGGQGPGPKREFRGNQFKNADGTPRDKLRSTNSKPKRAV